MVHCSVHVTSSLNEMATKNKICKPFSKSILLLLVWTVLLRVTIGLLIIDFQLLFMDHTPPYILIMYSVLWVMLPVAGWMGDSYLRRYRAIVVGVFATMLSFLILFCATVMLQFNWTPIPAIVLLYVYVLMTTCSMGGFVINMLPFIIDQMIGASADDISAIVQWYYWAYSLGISSQYLFGPLPISKLNLIMISFTIVFLCLSSVLITDCLCHKWLDIHYKSSSPFKTIFKVLNYARKTKYPEHRSAFTYIDEEEPSRLDYGKHKFGGPFTEEEVEDVKTIFRLLTLFLSTLGVFINSKLFENKQSPIKFVNEPADLQFMINILF